MLKSFNHGENQQISSTTSGKWWSFSLPALLLVLALFAGCGTKSDIVCSIPTDPANARNEDAVSLAEFRELPFAAQQDRRRRAEEFLHLAETTDRSDVRVTALANAAGLAPDNPETWLELAHIWRWIGDFFKVESCLDNAVAALRCLEENPSLSPEKIAGIKRQVSLDQALLRAWSHYDRGEWSKGMRWAKAAARIEPGAPSVFLIKGLLGASLGNSFLVQEIIQNINNIDMASTAPTWIWASFDRSQSKWETAFVTIHELNPKGAHSAECWREMGLIAEHLGSWDYARRWYSESGAAVPVDDKVCLAKRNAYRLDTSSDNVLMPVWLAFDRYFVTGSYSAYTSLALTKFEMATDPGDQDFWGGQVVNAAGILIRWGIDKCYAYRARGLVFLDKGKVEWGLRDLRRAADMLAANGLIDGRIEGELGHYLLLNEQPMAALGHLRSSTDLEPKVASVWGDLGMALVQLGESGEAERALTMAVGLDPKLVTAWYNRGLVYIHQKEFDLAEADLVKAADLAPDNQEIGALLQQLLRRKNR